MLRNNNFGFLLASRINYLNSFNSIQNVLSVESIRWRRKPRWLPTAPSKLFRVPERHVLPPEEKVEWIRLNNNYRTQVNSIRRFLIQEVEQRNKMIELKETPADEEAEFQRCLAINDLWNQEIAKKRNVRVEEENERRREEILQNIENKKQREQAILKEVEEKIKREQIAAKSYITRENIDQIIEQALANPIDFNFYIDLQGKRSDEISSEDKNVEQKV